MANSKPIDLYIDGTDGKIRPGAFPVTIGSGNTFETQNFQNLTGHPVTILFPGGLSPDGCIFGIEANTTKPIKISACAPRNVDIPFWVYFSDPSVKDWGIAESPPTMKIGP